MLHMADSMRHATTLALLLAACGTQPPAASPDADSKAAASGPSASGNDKGKTTQQKKAKTAGAATPVRISLEWRMICVRSGWRARPKGGFSMQSASGLRRKGSGPPVCGPTSASGSAADGQGSKAWPWRLQTPRPARLQIANPSKLNIKSALP